MKKKLSALLPVAVIIIVAFCWWYTSPVPVDKLTGVDWDQCTQIDGEFSVYDDSAVSGYTLSLTPEDELYDSFFQVCRTASLSRSITTLFTGGKVEIPQPNPGDADITVTCRMGGDRLVFRTTGDDMNLRLGDRGWHGTLPNMEVWLSTVTKGLVGQGSLFGVDG